jgi:membrane protein
VQRVEAVVARVMRLKPVRVFNHYAERRGGLLSAGLSYQAIFALFAAIWVGFAIAGAVVRSNPVLLQALFDLLETNAPGLIDSGDGGAVDPQVLLSASILNWTGAIAAVGLLFTALGWIASGRDAVRTLFGLPGQATNPVLLKLKDLGLAIGFGATVVISAALSVLSTTALSSAIEFLGLDEDSSAARIAARVVGLLLVVVIDVLVLATFYRVVSGIEIPMRVLAQGTIIAAVALGALKALGSTLLGGATSNPLLASFAVIIGLLIWFNLICQVILLGASWIAVSAKDAGIELTGARRVKPAARTHAHDVGTAL